MRKAALLSLMAVAASAGAADQTHYDLIRPVYPMTWSTEAAIDGGTALGFDKFDRGTDEHIKTSLPAEGAIPEEFKSNGFISDTLDQGFIDALSLNAGNILINQAGYLPSDPEQMFYYTSESGECSETFSVVDSEGEEVAKGGTFTPSDYNATFKRTVSAREVYLYTRYSVDLSGEEKKVCVGKLASMAGLPTNQRLRVKVGKEFSPTFIISDEVYSMVRDAGLKFFGAQRSGNSESWFHGPSHMNDGDGKLLGGWYDAGDHVKNSITMSYALMVLSTMATANPELDEDHYAYNHNEVEATDKIPDALREAKHGADFFLRSYVQAKGVIDDMAVSVGSFENDHMSWNRADGEATQAIAEERPVYLGNLGSNVSGKIAAGLALLSKSYAKYDKDFADSCLVVAEKLYDFARALALNESSYDDGKEFVHNKEAGGWNHSSFYPTEYKVNDKLAMAAVALLYATEGKSEKINYLDDLVSNKKINDNSLAAKSSPAEYFEGGWFGNSIGFATSAWPTDYENIHIFPLYAFYKLILADEKTSESFGIDSDARLQYIETVVGSLLQHLKNMSFRTTNSKTLNLTIGGNKSLKYNGLYFNSFENYGNTYDNGIQLALLMFSHITKDITEKNIFLSHLGNVSWNYEGIRQHVINRMNYILGMNPWGISMVVGVGDKNESHIHQRTSNPGMYNKWDINDPLTTLYPDYKYRPLVGALMSGSNADSLVSDIYDYISTDVTLHSGATFQAILMLLSKERSPATVDTSAKDTSITDSTEAIPQTPAFSKSLNVVRQGSVLEVNYTLTQPAPADIQLVSIKGKAIRKFNEHQGAGRHAVRFDLSEIPAGVYMVKATAGSLKATKKIHLTK